MRLSLTRLENITLTIIITPLMVSPVYLLFLVTCYPSTSGKLHSEFVLLLFLQDHRETDHFFIGSGVQFAEHNCDQFHYLPVVFSSQLKSKIGNILGKTATLRITLNIDSTPLILRCHRIETVSNSV
jgi:hypothetical protein